MEIIDKLQKEALFERLLPDIESGQVFPAIRLNRVDFYYGGGKLFTFDNMGFGTHLKYASIFENPPKSKIIRDADFTSIKPIPNFINGYDRIKELCSIYARKEAKGVATALMKTSRCRQNH
jgi:hypothetical protein